MECLWPDVQCTKTILSFTLRSAFGEAPRFAPLVLLPPLLEEDEEVLEEEEEEEEDDDDDEESLRVEFSMQYFINSSFTNPGEPMMMVLQAS